MACGVTDPIGCVPDIVTPAERVIGSGIEALADAIADALSALVADTITFWVDVPGIDVAGEDGVTARLRGYLLPIAVTVAVAGIMWSGLRMAITRKGDPLIDLGRGIFAVALWSTGGIAVTAGLLEASDVFSAWVL